jgi:hypothetical protein
MSLEIEISWLLSEEHAIVSIIGRKMSWKLLRKERKYKYNS